MRVFSLFLLIQTLLCATDFDVTVVGSSPFSLFEALYQSHSGKKVLILEESSTCGGAWKTISICGLSYIDLGCHQIEQNPQLKDFLKVYAGCHLTPKTDSYYFANGCKELIGHLLQLIAQTDIVLLTSTKLQQAWFDTKQNIATLITPKGQFTTKKLIVTPMSSFEMQPTTAPQSYTTSQYYHLYMLVQDPTKPRFTYYYNPAQGASRATNLTDSANIQEADRHLIVIQTHTQEGLSNAPAYLEALKEKGLIDPSARLLQCEPYIYETGVFNSALISQLNADTMVELLQTGHFACMTAYIERWTSVLKPFAE